MTLIVSSHIFGVTGMGLLERSCKILYPNPVFHLSRYGISLKLFLQMTRTQSVLIKSSLISDKGFVYTGVLLKWKKTNKPQSFTLTSTYSVSFNIHADGAHSAQLVPPTFYLLHLRLHQWVLYHHKALKGFYNLESCLRRSRSTSFCKVTKFTPTLSPPSTFGQTFA